MQRKPSMQKFGDQTLMNTKPKRLALYRKRHRRFDFYASPDVADIIAHHRVAGRESCIAGIIDGLIRAGHRAVSGNGKS